MTLVLTEDVGPVRHVILNRPEKRNAFNAELIAATGEALREAAADNAVRCVVVRGAGPMFSSGMDLASLAGLAETPENLRAFRREILDAWNRAEEMPKPSICVIHGACIGGALELALACDLRVVQTGAPLALPEPKRGLLPGWGGTQLLPRLVPPAIALELLLTGRDVHAEEALRIGLANRIADNALEGARELAAEISANSPTAVRHIRHAALRGGELSLADGLALEAEMMAAQRATADSREGVAAFIEKREPVWPGR
jgi:enoyl-CoA hydratase/carnithine racemase